MPLRVKFLTWFRRSTNSMYKITPLALVDLTEKEYYHSYKIPLVNELNEVKNFNFVKSHNQNVNRIKIFPKIFCSQMSIFSTFTVQLTGKKAKEIRVGSKVNANPPTKSMYEMG